MTVAVVIPARMASTRFPGKPLIQLAGKPMIQWVWESAQAAQVGNVVIATPDEEIRTVAGGFGATVEMTALSHPSGTDRIAEVADRVIADVYINVQGDEPLVSPEAIRACASAFQEESVGMSTLWEACDPADADNPAVVKLVTDLSGNALYFSRYGIPFPRTQSLPLKRHVGMYGYRRDVLLRFRDWEQTPLEKTESLEQLRFLENGVKIRVLPSSGEALGIDTPEQVAKVEALLLAR